MKRSFWIRCAAVAVLLTIAAAACAGCGGAGLAAETSATAAATTANAAPSKPAATRAPSPTPMPTPVPVDRNPLTGLRTMDPANAGKRPFGAMFSNIGVALPQLGIGSADLYYEMVVESGYTRIMALFADVNTVPEICSIRSTRNSFVDIAMGHDCLLAHFGASILCWDYMAAHGIETIDFQFYSAGCWRDPDIAAAKGPEHSVKTDAEHIRNAIVGKGMRDTLEPDVGAAFEFRHPESFEPASGETCSFFSIPFTDWSTSPTAGFTYEEDRRTYAKSQYGGPHIDGVTGEPIRVTNVFVLFTEIYPLDAGGHVAARLTDGGSGYYLSGGKMQEIRWDKGDIWDPLVYTDTDGRPLVVNAGKSYVCVVSADMADSVTVR